jgi:aldehyde:ferredoxin oxidoreductase
LALARAFNARSGFGVADDQIPERLFDATRDGKHADGGINREQWNRTREWTYGLLGWDPITGKPTRAKLADLGLLWLDD